MQHKNVSTRVLGLEPYFLATMFGCELERDGLVRPILRQPTGDWYANAGYFSFWFNLYIINQLPRKSEQEIHNKSIHYKARKFIQTISYNYSRVLQDVCTHGLCFIIIHGYWERPDFGEPGLRAHELQISLKGLTRS